MLRTFAALSICTFIPWFSASADDAPQTVSLSPELLLQNKQKLAANDAELMPAFKALLSDADKLLKQKPASVMDKPQAAASGDKHDYFSLGIYWWPDPDKPDGLPWIRKDGQRNPMSRDGMDATAFGRTNGNVKTLGLAYYFSGEEKYAAKAVELINVWYLEEATRMNPNMAYAQAVPGRNDGRSTGLIEGLSLTSLLDGVILLKGSKGWTVEKDKALRDWVADFYQWLRSSKNGLAYEKSSNNHGVYHDVIATHLALFLGREDEAKVRLQAALGRRLDKQIDKDGRQPHELGRTLSWSYSVFNLKGFFQLARMGELVGVDFWQHRGPDDQSLKAALDLLIPYLDEDKQWTLGEQIKKMDRKDVLPLLAQALEYQPNEDYQGWLNRFSKVTSEERWKLAR